MMKAAIYDGKELSINEIPRPELSATQVLIQVKAVGICGTDLAIINGSLPTPTPIILGHELSGEIIEIGDKVDPKWINKKVTSEINSNIDFDCYYCKLKQYSQCISRKALGIDIDGALAEYIAVESYLLHEIPENISFEEATFIEPLAAAYQIFEMMPLDENDKIIAIYGLGKLGMLITQVALKKGLKLIVVDGSHEKINLAKNFGAQFQINRFDCINVPDSIKTYTNGLGADIVIDATGNPLALKDVIASCRTRGKIHVKSTHGVDTPINLTDLVVRELTLYTSRCGPFEKAIEGLKSREIKVDKLITKKFDLKDIGKAVNFHMKNPEHIKAIIRI
ncbi:MAG: zinc-binding dehydrogenase [Promethearchaeota archaeon]